MELTLRFLQKNKDTKDAGDGDAVHYGKCFSILVATFGDVAANPRFQARSTPSPGTTPPLDSNTILHPSPRRN